MVGKAFDRVSLQVRQDSSRSFMEVFPPGSSREVPTLFAMFDRAAAFLVVLLGLKDEEDSGALQEGGKTLAIIGAPPAENVH